MSDNQPGWAQPAAKPLEAGNRARQDRPTEEAGERRRRRVGSLDMSAQLKLGCNPDDLDPNYQYRWVNDEPGKLHALTKNDDYDFVPPADVKGIFDTQDSREESSERMSRVVGTNKFGKEIKAYLLRKPMKYWLEDYGKEVKLREDELGKRVLDEESATSDPNAPNKAYLPRDNRLGTRRKA